MSAIRLAEPGDAAAMAAIYAPIVRDTAITFETTAPDTAAFERRIQATLPRFPWFVLEVAGVVQGYAYAGPHRTRAAYAWSVETSVYVAAPARGQGVGRRLYATLLEELTAQGFGMAHGGVTVPNPASIGLHRALGFEEVGVYRRVGFKAGRWHDVWWGARPLERPSAPEAPRPVNIEAWKARYP